MAVSRVLLLKRFAGSTLTNLNALLTLTTSSMMSKLVFSFLLSHILKTVLILIGHEDMISTDLFFSLKRIPLLYW